MKLAILAALLLVGCTTVQTPSCEQLVRGASTVEEIASLLAGLNIEPEIAAKVIRYAQQGGDVARVVCALRG